MSLSNWVCVNNNPVQNKLVIKILLIIRITFSKNNCFIGKLCTNIYHTCLQTVQYIVLFFSVNVISSFH